MVKFSPFPAVRYTDPRPDAPEGVLELEGVTMPYLAAADPTAYRDLFEDLNAYSTYRLLPAVSDDRMTVWKQWLSDGVLVQDETPSLYLYRIGHRDVEGRLHQIAGVVGAMSGLSEAADTFAADIVPVISTIKAPGFSELLAPTGVPLARATDSQGAHHRLWAITQQGVVNTIAEAVEGAAGTGRLDAPFAPEAGSEPGATRMAFVTEHITAEGLPALGMVFRLRNQ